jgi:hypothetical protein
MSCGEVGVSQGDHTLTRKTKDLNNTKNRQALAGYKTISGFKTSPQAQFLCWTEGFNTRNITYIPALESLAPP